MSYFLSERIGCSTDGFSFCRTLICTLRRTKHVFKCNPQVWEASGLIKSQSVVLKTWHVLHPYSETQSNVTTSKPDSSIPGVMLPQGKPVPGCMLMMKMCLVVTCWSRKRVLPGHKMSCSALLLPWPWFCGQNHPRQWCREEAVRHQGSNLGSKISWVSFHLPPPALSEDALGPRTRLG